MWKFSCARSYLRNNGVLTTKYIEPTSHATKALTCDLSCCQNISAGNHIERQLYNVLLRAKWFRVHGAIALCTELVIKERPDVKRLFR